MGNDVQLTKAQREFLKFHADEPWPHKWEWLGADNPQLWDRLRAHKAGSYRTVSREELAHLSKIGFLRAFKVTPAGRAALNTGASDAI
jgi:hypothetical protein